MAITSSPSVAEREHAEAAVDAYVDNGAIIDRRTASASPSVP